jgi:hypothetical protein
MPTSNINDEMRQAAEYAVRIAKEKFGQDLDFSESGLSRLEEIVEQAHQQFNNNKQAGIITSDKALNRTASVWGSYFGELIRGKFGGNWIMEESRRLIVVNGQQFSPIDYVHQRVTGQHNVNVLTYFGDVSNKLFLRQINPMQSAQPEQVIRTTTQRPYKKGNTPSISFRTGLLVTAGVGLAILLIIMLMNRNSSSVQSPTQDLRLDPGYVSETQFGPEWPFTVPEGVVLCVSPGVEVLETRVGTFGLTGYSNTAGFTNIKDSGIWKMDSSGWGLMPMSKFINYAHSLCQ